jgi:hypothetical protein
LLNRLETQQAELKAYYERQPEPLRRAAQYLPHLDEYSEILSQSVQIFACMAVEAFLNYYGVVRLGEDVYYRLHERHSIHKKLATLLRVCDATNLPRDSELAQLVRRMFERRNDLVHPKARELQEEVVLGQELSLLTRARDAAKDAQRFGQLFCQYSPGVHVSEFK